MSELPELSLLTSVQKDELIMQLFAQVKAFSAQIEQFEAKQSKNSRNSQKPPSSDGLGKKKRPPSASHLLIS